MAPCLVRVAEPIEACLAPVRRAQRSFLRPMAGGAEISPEGRVVFRLTGGLVQLLGEWHVFDAFDALQQGSYRVVLLGWFG